MRFFTIIFLLFLTIVYGYSQNKVYQTLQSWNNANNNKSLKTLSLLYASNITYYGKRISKKQCLKDKKRLFKKYPYFRQKIDKIKITSLTPRLFKISFNKYVSNKPNSSIKMYPSYLVINTVNSYPIIVEEGDKITDKNIKNKKLKTYNIGKQYQLKGKIIKIKHYGPPGFGENPKHDKLLTSYILKLNKPIKVITKKPVLIKPITITKEIELWGYKNYKEFDNIVRNNKEIIIKGELFDRSSPYHYKDILIFVKSINH